MRLPALAAIAAVVALAGCQTMPSPEGKPQKKLTCDGAGKCEAAVSVVCPLLVVCKLQVEYDPIVVVKKQKLTIAWQLPSDSSFRFDPKNGIVFDDEGKPVFDCRVEQNGLRFVCDDKHPGFSVYKYTINVTGNVSVHPLDPWAVND
jgi:hypothetical protein